MTQMDIYNLLEQNEGRKYGVIELAKIFDKNPGSINRALKRLRFFTEIRNDMTTKPGTQKGYLWWFQREIKRPVCVPVEIWEDASEELKMRLVIRYEEDKI